jgi:hypothetical protein
MNSYKYSAPDLLRFFNTVAKLLLFDFLMLLSDWYNVYIRILKWVVGRHLLANVKMDGAVGYRFGLVSEESVHEVVSGIRVAFNRVIDVLILFIICTNTAVFKYMNGVFKVHNTEILHRRSGCLCKLYCHEIKFFNILIFPNDTTYDLS